MVMLGACAVACGGKAPEAKEPSAPQSGANDKAPADGVVRPITQGQLQVAHFASGDGTIGLVLDRTGKTPKVQIDGEKEITELTMVEDVFAGQRRGFYLKSPDGKNVLYLSTGGSLKIFRGRDSFALSSDAPAKPLPAATVTGQWVAAKSEWDKHVEALTPLSFLAKSSQFTSEDSGNLAKVSEAIAVVTPDLLVRVTERGAKDARWNPASPYVGNTEHAAGSFGLNPSNNAWADAKAKGGLAKWGGELDHDGVQFNRPTRSRMFALKGWAPPLAVGTPGFIWEMRGGTVVFVTLDGGRYQISVGNDPSPVLEKGAGPQSGWPAPLQHALVDMGTVRMFAKGKAIPENVAKEIDTLDDAYFDCFNKVWKSAKEERDKIEASALSANEKWGKLSGVEKSAELKAPKQCAPDLKKLETRLISFIEARNVERTAIYDKAKSRFK
ncbi:MAG: hypothetical protein KF819_02540 [Labilithrix sp.]|nr:hypothetical protein [Labilithrix sp.]